jgi:hypothetical protein
MKPLDIKPSSEYSLDIKRFETKWLEPWEKGGTA